MIGCIGDRGHMMGKRYVILGGNQVKTKLVSQKLSHLLGLEIIDGDRYIEAGEQEEILSLIKKQDWIIQTKYNRILRLCDDKADYVIFVDFPLWINVKDILLRLRLNHLKEILHYQKIRRPWVVDRLEEFGIEKKIVVLKNRRQVREFLKSCE